MPVLTNFLSVTELESKEEECKEYTSRLNKFRKIVDDVSETFNVRLTKESELGQKIAIEEEYVFKKFWQEVQFIPESFALSSLYQPSSYYDSTKDKSKLAYNYLADLSKYPIVELSQLKQLADTLSFVILPIDYINMESVFKMYYEQDRNYGTTIKQAYEFFKKVTSECETYTGKQQFYMLAPLSFYDPWVEVSNEKVLPKYFSSKLDHLSMTLGLIIPTQRNLYKMTSTNATNVDNLQTTMKSNFVAVTKAITDCQSRIDWVVDYTRNLDRKIESVAEKAARKAEMMQIRLGEMQKQVTELEYKLYCLLDPIIFSVNEKIDVSSSDSDSTDARIGLCFGTDMPIEFFTQKGMVLINDKRCNSIVKIMNI